MWAINSSPVKGCRNLFSSIGNIFKVGYLFRESGRKSSCAYPSASWAAQAGVKLPIYHQSFVLSWMKKNFLQWDMPWNKILGLLCAASACDGGSRPHCKPGAWVWGKLQLHQALWQMLLQWVGFGQVLPGSELDITAVICPLIHGLLETLCRGLCSLLNSSVGAVPLKG